MARISLAAKSERKAWRSMASWRHRKWQRRRRNKAKANGGKAKKMAWQQYGGINGA
jgi:hypothetical protein